MSQRYRSRRPHLTKIGDPAILWNVTTPSPPRGMEHVIYELRKYFNPYHSEMQWDLQVPRVRNISVGDWMNLNLKNLEGSAGLLSLGYLGTATDTSTYEHKLAQRYMAVFRIGELSQPYRDIIVADSC